MAYKAALGQQISMVLHEDDRGMINVLFIMWTNLDCFLEHIMAHSPHSLQFHTHVVPAVRMLMHMYIYIIQPTVHHVNEYFTACCSISLDYLLKLNYV